MQKFFKKYLTKPFFFFLYLLDIKEHCLKVAVRTLCLLYLLIISVCDIRTGRIPDCMTALFFAAAFCKDLFLSPKTIPESLSCAFLFFLIFFSVSVLTKGLGMGDAKLAAVLGYCEGFFGASLSLSIASVLGLLAFMLLPAEKRDAAKLPFAPFMSAGYAVSSVLCGGAL